MFCPWWRCFLCEIQTLRAQICGDRKHKLTPSGPVEVVLCRATPTPAVWLSHPCISPWKQPHSVIMDLVSILNLDDGAHGVSSHNCCLRCILKRSSVPLSARSFWMVWDVMGPVHLMAMCSPLHLHCCKMVSLV